MFYCLSFTIFDYFQFNSTNSVQLDNSIQFDDSIQLDTIMALAATLDARTGIVELDWIESST